MIARGLLAMASLTFTVPAAADPVVKTANGSLHGAADEVVTRFLGVPYAASPIGDRRWTAPAPAPAWRGTRDATTAGPACAGQTRRSDNPIGATSEDCLYLNVVTPTKRDSRRALPVMVWLHGGGFTAGEGAMYDPAPLVRTGRVIVVTINYRLGVLGFFGLRGLDASGSFGLLDQQAALRWVRKEIAAFGGDPENVTLFGESAGGFSTCAQLAAPGARGLFHKAIVQSGPCNLVFPVDTIYPGVPKYRPYVAHGDLEAQGEIIARQLGCGGEDQLACLRRLKPDDFAKIQPLYGRPAYGTPTLPIDPAIVLRNRKLHPVPLMQGVTRDEMTGYVAAQPGPLDTTEYRAQLAKSFGARAEALAAAYPVERYPSPQRAWAAVASDAAFACAANGFNLAASRGGAPLWSYEFADRTAPNIGYAGPAGFAFDASHAFELSYLFDTAFTKSALTPAQMQLSARMIEAWVSFAETGDPGWPRYTAAAPYVAVLGDVQDAPGGFARRHHCNLWQR